MKLPGLLYWQCRKLFLKCAQFEEYRRLSDFCNPQEELGFLVEDIVQEKTRSALVDSFLSLLADADETGDVFLVFVKALQDNCHQGKDLLNDLNKLYTEIQEFMKKSKSGQLPKTSSPQKLFNSILNIDFIDQETKVIEALDWEKLPHKTAAFLVHGEKNFGQGTLVTRLLQLQPLQNGLARPPIAVEVSKMFDIFDIWNKVAEKLGLLKETASLSQEEIKESIFDFLQSQNLIFIFYEKVMEEESGSKQLPVFWYKLIQDFWQPVVEKANHQETYLVMFLIDNEGRVCQSGVPLAEEVNHPQYPNIPLCLPPAKKFTRVHLIQWLRTAVNDRVVDQGLCVDTLGAKSKDGVPELVYQKICEAYGCSWKGDWQND
ncbi:hypothetical protein QT970_00825 [Microcoleus sp. herbarium8]|uniref:hypothetical protein n=1 Tax=Microcoleus sp. herbarium8 TaxID=3055436 RepID=UPI002FD475D1